MADSNLTKTCLKCEAEKPLFEFSRRKSRVNGVFQYWTDLYIARCKNGATN